MKTSQLKFGVYLSYASIFVSNGTNLILTPFIIRSLGNAEYGLYMLIGSLVSYIATIDFGLSNATIRFVAKYRAENDHTGEEKFVFSTLILYAVISFIVLLVGVVIVLNLGSVFNSLTRNEVKIAKIMFAILVVDLALTLPMNLFIGIITAYEQFVLPRLLNILRTLIRAAVLFLFLSFGFKAVAIVAVDATLNFVMMLIIISYAFWKIKVRIRRHHLNISFYEEVFSYSAWVFVSVVVDQIYWRIGQFVLGVVASTTEVAIFAVGMTFGQYFISFSTAISGVFLPKITKMVATEASGDDLTDMLIKTGRLQFLVLGFAVGGFILFGHKFLVLWVGPSYEESWTIALSVMVPLVIVLSQTIGISILQAKNIHRFRALMYLAISVVNVGISFYLARVFGAVGAAVGTTLSLVFGNILAMNIYYHVKAGLNIPRFYKELSRRLLPCLVGSVVIGSALLLISQKSWIALVIQCTAYAVIYSSIMWVFGMNSYERQLFSHELKKLLGVGILGKLMDSSYMQ